MLARGVSRGVLCAFCYLFLLMHQCPLCTASGKTEQLEKEKNLVAQRASGACGAGGAHGALALWTGLQICAVERSRIPIRFGHLTWCAPLLD
ncbi:hypothetical protein NDU88_005727 [Pleurodeles waltl]|uniref:Secreted protein n=1 Tax=Pleurodeles waltl TaxID=8319 RepID=A0AAV7QJ32_PLEWA|nr:hypothetical protein NDU88_005727 [Pleurodeles waltl]